MPGPDVPGPDVLGHEMNGPDMKRAGMAASNDLSGVTSPVHPGRVRRLDDGSRSIAPAGTHVLYWMQRSVRAVHNDALEHALAVASWLDLPLHVVFGLTGDYPEATSRHLRFHIEGLREVAAALTERGVPFAVRHGHPPDVAIAAASGAACVVTDRAYLRHLAAWRTALVDAVPVPVIEVEGDVVVPVDAASGKHEHAARTIRPKIVSRRDEHLQPLAQIEVAVPGPPLDGLDLTDVDAVLRVIGVWGDGASPAKLRGGTSEAARHLELFTTRGLDGYSERSPDPLGDGVSHQAPYLHFGHVSPVAVALTIRASSAGTPDDVAGFLEQLIVRRELAINHVRFEPAYDRYEQLPAWSRRTLDAHRDDAREHIYSRDELAASQTHDDAWNACQTQVREEGYLHNHLRMYWGKQVVKWSATPEDAFANLLWINNHYLLDGRDCASYTSVAWIFGVHDRGWQETPVAGTTRPMTRGGLDRKLTKAGMRRYLDAVDDAHGSQQRLL
jgi:deoxyribodipyrimidine photo-lyase